MPLTTTSSKPKKAKRGRQHQSGAIFGDHVPDLRSYDWIFVNSSGGKDSQVMLDEVYRLAKIYDVVDRIVVVHCDLDRVEWKGTRELTEKQARCYPGVRFRVVKRPQGDLLQQVLQRWASLRQAGRFDVAPWPSPKERWCTSDQKRAQVMKVMTSYATISLNRGVTGRQVRILNCMGLRGQESCNRSELPTFEFNKLASNKTKRHVDNWLPIHGWSVEQVWARIKKSGVPYHSAYDLGMPRLSCVFCIYAPYEALLLAAYHNKELLNDYVEVEKKVGFSFKIGLPMAKIQIDMEAGVQPGPITTWEM